MQKDRFFKYQNANAVINFLCRIFTGNWKMDRRRSRRLENWKKTVEEFEMFEEFAKFENQRERFHNWLPDFVQLNALQSAF